MLLTTKTLTQAQLDIVQLLLTGALAPQTGFLSRADVLSVTSQFRLKNGKLAALPLALPLNASEKHSAQVSGRIALTDADDRLIAEVHVTELYRLPAETIEALKFFDPQVTTEHWFAAGTISAVKPILYARFKQSRPTVGALKAHFKQKRWNTVVAIQANPTLNENDAHQACEWLFSRQRGGLLIQALVDETSDTIHEDVHQVRNQIRCSAAKEVKLTLLPVIQGLTAPQEALLQALICRNSGVTALVVGSDTPTAVKQWLQRYRDELDLELIVTKRPRQAASHLQSPSVTLQHVA